MGLSFYIFISLPIVYIADNHTIVYYNTVKFLEYCTENHLCCNFYKITLLLEILVINFIIIQSIFALLKQTKIINFKMNYIKFICILLLLQIILSICLLLAILQIKNNILNCGITSAIIIFTILNIFFSVIIFLKKKTN